MSERIEFTAESTCLPDGWVLLDDPEAVCPKNIEPDALVLYSHVDPETRLVRTKHALFGLEAELEWKTAAETPWGLVYAYYVMGVPSVDAFGEVTYNPGVTNEQN